MIFTSKRSLVKNNPKCYNNTPKRQCQEKQEMITEIHAKELCRNKLCNLDAMPQEYGRISRYCNDTQDELDKHKELSRNKLCNSGEE